MCCALVVDELSQGASGRMATGEILPEEYDN